MMDYDYITQFKIILYTVYDYFSRVLLNNKIFHFHK